MNRRRFLTTTAATVALVPMISASAHEERPVRFPLIELFEMFPDQPGEDGFSFPITTGIVGSLQRTVWPENPAMYWDPIGEDYMSIFDFHPAAMMLSASQEGAELWSMNLEMYGRDSTRVTLEANGWQIDDADLGLYRYAGNEDDRSSLAASLNLLGNTLLDGEWDWVALPDDITVVMGSDGDKVRAIVDRAVNSTFFTTVGDRVRPLSSVIHEDSYLISVLPPEHLPVMGADVSFVSRSWTGDIPIIHSIGMQLGTAEEVEQIIEAVVARLKSERSRLANAPYSDFLELSVVKRNGGSVRFDLISKSDVWDVFDALNSDDLQMLPPD